MKLAISPWDELHDGVERAGQLESFSNLRPPDGMSQERFSGIVRSAVQSAHIIVSGRPRIAIICPTIDEFTALRGALYNTNFVPPASKMAAGFRAVAMTYRIAEVPTVDEEGTVTGRTEPVVCAHVSRQGLTSMSFAVTSLLHAFPTVNHVVLCGVAAGVPTPPPSKEEWKSTLPAGKKGTKQEYHRVLLKHGETDVRLGDIVLGEAAIQFDFGKATMRGFEPRGEPIRACEQMRSINDRLFERMKSDGERPWDTYLDSALSFASKYRTSVVKRPKHDELWHHRLERNANDELVIVRGEFPLPRGISAHKIPNGRPNVFRSKVGSSDMVMKDSTERDKVGRRHGVGVLEMEGSAALEAAAAIGDCRGLIVRGICDYADADKNDDWWMYAACGAAAYARCVVERLHLQLDVSV